MSSHQPPDTDGIARARRAPWPLTLAVALVGLEVLVLLVLGIVELGVLDARRVTMGVTTVIFFVVYGGGLAVCGWLLLRLRSWARAPVVLAQLIQICVAWSFRGGSTTAVAAALVVVAVAVLVGVFHPSSLAALDAEDAEDRDHPDRS